MTDFTVTPKEYACVEADHEAAAEFLDDLADSDATVNGEGRQAALAAEFAMVRADERARCVAFVRAFQGGWASCLDAADALERGDPIHVASGDS